MNELRQELIIFILCFQFMFCLIQLIQMIYQRWSYFTDYTNYFELGVYISTIVYVGADFDLSFVDKSLTGQRYCFKQSLVSLYQWI